MKTKVVFAVLLLCLASIGTGSSQPSLSRHIHVAKGGLVFVTDTIPVESDSMRLELGIPPDMSKNLVGYMLAGQEGDIEVKGIEDDVLWILVKPADRWVGGAVSVVTVWRNMLVESSGGQYLMVIPANPILREKIEKISVALSFDGTPSITSVTPITVSSDKTTASGEVKDIDALQFRTITAYFEIPDLIRYVVERANVKVDLATNTIEAQIHVRNAGTTPFNSMEFYLGKNVTVSSTTAGLLKLGHSWDAGMGVLTVSFPDTLKAGEGIAVNIVYVDRNIARQTDGQTIVRLPQLLNTTFADYALTVKTPPAESLSFDGEPWSLKVVENNRREVMFRYTDIYVTGRETVRLTVAEVQTFPTPALLLLAVAVVASVQIITLRQRRTTRETPAQLTNLRKAVEKLVETILGELDSLKREKPAKPSRLVEDQTRLVMETIAEVRKGVKTGELAAGLNTLDKLVRELHTTLQAISKTTEDYGAGRLSRSVFQRVSNEYRKACNKTVGEIYDVLDRISRQG
ncbi:MAG: hypothetical protein QW614_04555 [Candidatus Caldarchaeum sp.]